MLPARPFVQIANVLADSLAPAFEALCTERYGGALPLHRSVPPGSSPPTLLVRLDRPAPPRLEAAFVIRHLGGNMYDVQGRVEGLPPRSFSYCLPERAALLAPAAPQLAREMAVFLLDALERQLGRDLLRQTVGRGDTIRPPLSPSPTSPRARPRDPGPEL